MSIPRKMIKFEGRQYYSESFKKHVVQEVESGRLTKEGARLKYKIGGNSAVLRWCRKYGKYHDYKESKGDTMKTSINDQIYKKRIKELEKALSESRVRSLYLESVIEIVEERTGVNMEKKYEEILLSEQKKKPKKKV